VAALTSFTAVCPCATFFVLLVEEAAAFSLASLLAAEAAAAFSFAAADLAVASALAFAAFSAAACSA
jgi:hypothetical protein